MEEIISLLKEEMLNSAIEWVELNHSSILFLSYIIAVSWVQNTEQVYITIQTTINL